MQVKIRFSKKRFKVKDLLMLEDARMGDAPNTGLVELMSKCLAGPDGEYMEPGKAREAIEQLDWDDYAALTDAFTKGMRDFQAGAVPPVTGGS
jgi:hypothetical protein